MSDVQKVLEQLTAVDAAIAAGRYGLQGEYRIAAVLLQLAGALQAREPQPAPAPLLAAGPPSPHPPVHLSQTLHTATGPHHVSATVYGLPPGARADLVDGELVVRQNSPSADKASIHPPTTCVYEGPSGGLCGELIRFTEANGWYHVNDRRLGVSTHSATPQVTPGRLPARPV